MKKTQIFTLFLAMMILSACQDWSYERVSFPEIATGAVSDVTTNSAVLNGVIDGLRVGETVDQHGHVWSRETEMPTLEENDGQTSLGREGNTSFLSEVDNLSANTSYFFRAYMVFNGETTYGEASSFGTDNFSVFIENIEVNGDHAIIDWVVAGYIGDPEKLGVVWSDSNQTPALDDQRTELTAPFLNCTTPCPVRDSIGNLAPNTNYYLRAYLLPGDGASPVFSETVRFHTFPEPAGWRRLNDFASGVRTGALTFTLGETVLLGGGWNGQGNPVDLWAYDPDGDSWSRKSDIPGIGFNSHTGLSVDSKGYLILREANGLVDLRSYDPGTDNWVQLSKPGIPFKEGRAISIKSLGYYIDGDLHVQEFDPGSSGWRIADTLSSNGIFLGAVDGKGYLVTTGNDVLEFDPAASPGNRFTPRDDFPGQTLSTVFVLNGKVYIGLGAFQDSSSNWNFPIEFWQFNPDAPVGNQWKRMPDFAGPGREGGAGFSQNGKGYVVAGSIRDDLGNEVFLKEVWEFTPPE